MRDASSKSDGTEMATLVEDFETIKPPKIKNIIGTAGCKLASINRSFVYNR